jgi:nucleoside-diphosphate-sugar epimerase
MNRIDPRGRTILVTGATGHQGGATARHLLAAGWQVRALVRDAAAPAAAALVAAGAELVRGDLNDDESVAVAMRGAYGVFSVQSANRDEIAQGKRIADTAKSEGVQHLVYSSVGGVESQNRYYLEHGWGPIDKWQIEVHLRDLGVPMTILRPGGFMEDFTNPARFFQNGSLNVPWHDELVMNLLRDRSGVPAQGPPRPDGPARLVEPLGCDPASGAVGALNGPPISPGRPVQLRAVNPACPESCWARTTYSASDV